MVRQNTQYTPNPSNGQYTQLTQVDTQQKKRRGIYLLLCFFLGAFGAHRFYAKKKGTGIIMLLLSCFGVPQVSAVWAMIDFFAALFNKKKVI